MTTPVAGAHYPRSLGELLAWFSTDEDCLDYLEWLRWPEGSSARAARRSYGFADLAGPVLGDLARATGRPRC